MSHTQGSIGHRMYFLCICIALAAALAAGCSHLSGNHAKSDFQEANDLFHSKSYQASIHKYQSIIERYPTAADRGLFELGLVYAHPQNEKRDYRKALDSFRKLIQHYPSSGYRQDSEMMVFYIHNVLLKDELIAAQQARIDALRQELRTKGDEIGVLQQKIEALQRELSAAAVPTGPADKVLVEKKARRLTLLSKGEAIKTYKIALGGNPEGPKERQGDNKTPEGNYIVDRRNRDSNYHLSLHISYPNEADKRRARALGVSPGGDIMIHGIKSGFSWVGELHAEIDWTQGCIAVTDQEIEEIDRLVPDGTAVEIRP